MAKAPVVIHQYGRPTRAIDVDGKEIVRKDRIFVEVYRQWFPVMDYDNHFVYQTNKLGVSLLCTCGSTAAAVGYHEYGKYCSYKGSQVIACLAHTNTGKHSDGSS